MLLIQIYHRRVWLGNNKLTKFPQNSSQTSENKVVKRKILRNHRCCSCGFPDWVHEMVGCNFK